MINKFLTCNSWSKYPQDFSSSAEFLVAIGVSDDPIWECTLNVGAHKKKSKLAMFSPLKFLDMGMEWFEKKGGRKIGWELWL